MAKGAASQLDRLTQTVAIVGFCGLVIMALLIFYDGAARTLNAPRISGFADFGEVIFPIVIASCFPAGLLRQTNVTVRVSGKIGGPRLNATLESFAALVTLIFFAILVWQFIVMTGKFADAGRTTRTIDVPLAPWWWGATAIMALCLPVQAYVTWAWMRAAVAGHPPDHAGLGEAGSA
ncbi:MAG: TRAP transporter small permease subunit [Pseudomonadota bacterium]